MKFKQNSFIILWVAVNVAGCSRVTQFFPDKEKDYQLTREIPLLVVPSDLSADAIDSQPTLPEQKTNRYLVEQTEVNNQKNKEIIYVDLVEYSGGATRIRIEDSMERSWRTVGKALSRHSIEITDRNEFDRVYFVQYDPDFTKVEDGSLWDEAKFLFGTDPAKEKEFKVKLAENGSLTEIIVLDQDNQPLSTGSGLKLLNLLYKSIKKDLAN